MNDVDASLRKLVMNTVEDLVTDFVSYDRKEDEELSRDYLLDMIRRGVVSREDIVAHFDLSLCEALAEVGL